MSSDAGRCLNENKQFQRISPAIDHPFSDSAPSIPVPFASSAYGSLAAFGASPKPGTIKWYGTSGNSFVAVVEFGPRVRAHAITAGGESGHLNSPHFNDEALRYASGDLRNVALSRRTEGPHRAAVSSGTVAPDGVGGTGKRRRGTSPVWAGKSFLMTEGPYIAEAASLIGDPARANILAALVGGRALAATRWASPLGSRLRRRAATSPSSSRGASYSLPQPGGTVTSAWHPRPWPRCSRA